MRAFVEKELTELYAGFITLINYLLADRGFLWEHFGSRNLSENLFRSSNIMVPCLLLIFYMFVGENSVNVEVPGFGSLLQPGLFLNARLIIFLFTVLKCDVAAK